MGLEKSAVKTIPTVWWSGFVRCSAGSVGHRNCCCGGRVARSCINPTNFQDVCLLLASHFDSRRLNTPLPESSVCGAFFGEKLLPGLSPFYRAPDQYERAEPGL